MAEVAVHVANYVVLYPLEKEPHNVVYLETGIRELQLSPKLAFNQGGRIM